MLSSALPKITTDGGTRRSDNRLLVVVTSGKTEGKCLEFARQFAGAIRSEIRIMRPASIDPADEVRSMATVFKADWICMVTAGGPGLLTLFLKSEDERILRLAPCPVVCFPESLLSSRATESENYLSRSTNRILVPLHSTHDSRAVLEPAILLAERFEAKIDLLRVSENLPGLSNSTRRSIHSARNVRTGVAMNELPALGKTSLPRHLQGRLEVSWGVPFFHATSRAMRKFESDLIVLALQNRLWHSRSRVDIGTERILRSVNCPVICVPEKHVRSTSAQNEQLGTA